MRTKITVVVDNMDKYQVDDLLTGIKNTVENVDGYIESLGYDVLPELQPAKTEEPKKEEEKSAEEKPASTE